MSWRALIIIGFCWLVWILSRSSSDCNLPKPEYHMTKKLPAIFIGHGSPMLALAEDDPNVLIWKRLGKELPRPKAILSLSAHWYVGENCVTAQAFPRTIHDFGRFPQELFDVQYPAPGSPELAERVAQLQAEVNNGNRPRLDRDSWGLDHGTWAVLRHMYPDADIPVVQMSLDARKPQSYHYRIGRQLAKLREEGILIIGSGNLVHNFATVSETAPTPQWAKDFVQWIEEVSHDKSIDRNDAENYPIVHWQEQKNGRKSQNGPDHFIPALYVLGTADQDEEINWFGQNWTFSTIAMASFQVGH